ncbi:MAG TPA: ABC transporter ATP-binding protein, partial [Euryarchaeota archaeon]|nr:ABC transporter ATP-binding protein [Euryarchaeota archaeon]
MKEERYERRYAKKGVLRRLLKYLLKRWPILVASTLCVILYANATSIMPIIISKTIDLGISQADFQNTLKYALIYLLVVALSGVLWFLVRYLSELLSQSVSHDIRVEAFQAIYAQSMDFFDNIFRGQLVSRIINDTNRIGRTVSWQLRNIFNVLFTAALSLYYMLTMNPRLFSVALISLAIMALVNTRYVLLIRPIYDKIRYQLGVLTSVVTDNLNGFKTVRALAIEDYEKEKFSKENDEFLELNLNAAKVRAIYGNLSQLVLGGSLTAIVYFGGSAVIRGTLTIGELTAFISYMMLLMWPMRALGFTISSLQRGLAAASRVFEIMDRPPRIKDKPNAIELKDVRGEIVFEDVHFSYVEGKPVLKGVSFKISPGEKVLITGPPGSGKSTILKLLLRFYEPDKGRILIDGYDISEVTLDSLRRHLGVVHQEPFIFSGTIKENILFGNPNAPMEDVIRAA